ncbi:hypothetical protein PIB30_071021 [Stylosanthes scabra]|uniref:RNase H type-1 domain-containing protein n=1 Tax=Stylosanthes scabra TaxID=79078 RepID=A0ABU6YMH4_9FABA|nr:hypothetical protein [Stylosanthes scabra]
MAKYLEKAKELLSLFQKVQMKHIPQKENDRADTLSKLASTKPGRGNRTLIQETKEKPSIDEVQTVLSISESESWRNPITKFLIHGTLPEDKVRGRSENSNNPLGSTRRSLRTPSRSKSPHKKNSTSRHILAHHASGRQGIHRKMLEVPRALKAADSARNRIISHHGSLAIRQMGD